MFRNFSELWKYRTLVNALVVRHLSMRYRGSVLGFLWSFLNPLCLMLVYTLVFKYYMRIPMENYSIYLFCGLLPWIWVTSALTEGTTAIASSGSLITKSMFPAHILPTVSCITNMIHYLLALPLLFIFMLIFGMKIHWTVVFVPFLMLAELLMLYGMTLALSALNVKYRDVQHILGNLLTFVFFLCPILYRVEDVEKPLVENGMAWAFELFNLNPFWLLTVCYHDLILNGTLPAFSTVCYIVWFVIFFVLLGNYIFNRSREGFAELL